MLLLEIDVRLDVFHSCFMREGKIKSHSFSILHFDDVKVNYRTG